MMKLTIAFLLLGGTAFTLGTVPPMFPRQHPDIRPANRKDAGEPLYLTPYIESGDIATGQQLSAVVDPLDGIENDPFESYAGLITVRPETDSHMFFWFAPATEVDPSQAPVVVWLQGGPGASSLFGMLEIHGPIQAEGFNPTVAVPNEYTWNHRANMLYIDNPIGAGYSYTTDPDNGLPTTQQHAGEDLYSFLTQFFTLYPEYQPNDFYVFGESYAGKWVPTIARKIDMENPTASVFINLKGIGIGDGFMSPPDSAIYGDELYQMGLIDGDTRDECKAEEALMKSYAADEQWYQAWATWNSYLGSMNVAMGCPYYYDTRICTFPPEEDNYATYVQYDTTRKAIHVGDLCFNCQSSDVYYAMLDDFMRSQRDDVEYLLDRYSTLIYNGNFDIICNHPGILEMFYKMTSWSGANSFYDAKNAPWRSNGEVAGYLKSVDNLRLFTMRNAGHMVPRSQPAFGQDMFENFIAGTL